jgi:hypothetical protein
MKRTLRAAALTAALLTILPGSAGAVSGGTDTGDSSHTNVGMIRFTQPDGRFRCSGTLIAPRLVLTAAHCTQDSKNVVVTFDNPGPADPQKDASVAGRYISGTAYADPDFTGRLNANKLGDAGVVVLDAPASSKWPGIRPADVAGRGDLDRLTTRELKAKPVTLVGYGIYYAKPGGSGPQKPTAQNRDPIRRLMTTANVINLFGDTLKTQEQDANALAGGGTCNGDSGGPAFIDGKVVGITSYGASQFCDSWGAYQRTDTAGVQSFLAPFWALGA